MSDKWSTLDRLGRTGLLLTDGTDDKRLYIPASAILNWEIDWVPEGGRISLRWTTGHGSTDITFDAGDHGAACAEANNDLIDVCLGGLPAS